MKYSAVATSTFHGAGMSERFCGLTEGWNVRRLKHKRAYYCLDYSHNNSHVCGCGFPLGHTKWEVFCGGKKPYAELDVSECADRRGYIMIHLYIRNKENNK